MLILIYVHSCHIQSVWFRSVAMSTGKLLVLFLSLEISLQNEPTSNQNLKSIYRFPSLSITKITLMLILSLPEMDLHSNIPICKLCLILCTLFDSHHFEWQCCANSPMLPAFNLFWNVNSTWNFQPMFVLCFPQELEVIAKTGMFMINKGSMYKQ